MRTLLVLCLLAGCTPATIYVPVATAPGDAKISYAVHGNPDHGMVVVRSFPGVRLPTGRNAPAFYLRMRLEADNRQDSDRWIFSPNDQVLAYHGTMLAPAFVETSAGRPVLAVAAGTQGWMDLYFPLPREVDPLEVTLWWRVRRGTEVAGTTTDFMRLSGRDPEVEGEPPIAYDLYMPGSSVLGWWWPGAGYTRLSVHSYGGGGSGQSTATPQSSSSGDWRGSSGSSNSSSDGSDSSSSSGSGSGSGSGGDSAKSAWRGGGRR